MKTPIVIFAFNRPNAFTRMVDSLKQNIGFDEHPVYVYIDGPRGEQDKAPIKEVINIARTLTDNVTASSENKGLANSIILGVSQIISRYGKVIVLEDDLILMPGFLHYMDSNLTAFKDDNRIISVCGFGLEIKKPLDYKEDIYLSIRSSSWGWGTWEDRWRSIDWNVKSFPELKKSFKKRRAFNKGGSDMYSMLNGYMIGKNNSWAIRFCYHQYVTGTYSVHPFKSLVSNEGFGEDATNCRQIYNRFKVKLQRSDYNQSTTPHCVHPDFRILRELRQYHSLHVRIYSYIRKLLKM